MIRKHTMNRRSFRNESLYERRRGNLRKFESYYPFNMADLFSHLDDLLYSQGLKTSQLSFPDNIPGSSQVSFRIVGLCDVNIIINETNNFAEIITYSIRTGKEIDSTSFKCSLLYRGWDYHKEENVAEQCFDEMIKAGML